MRVLISGGGTGGHVYPALAVAAQLNRAAANRSAAQPEPSRQRVAQPRANGAQQRAGEHRTAAQAHDDSDRDGSVEVLWVGSIGGMEEALVERTGLAYQGISTGQIRGINPLRALTNAGRMAAGVRDGLAVVGSFRPDVCLVTGGYVCAPMALACRLRQVPVMIYLPDMTPGASIRSLSRLAARVAVSFPEAASYFGGEMPNGKAVVTGYPVRQELVEAAIDRPASRRRLAERLQRPLAGNAEPPLVLIFGGSQGSRSINQATWSALKTVLPHAHVLHVVGVRDWPLYQEDAARHPLQAHEDRYHPVEYLHDEMTLALAAADLAVARAGASTLGEFPVAGLPSILVPLPYAGVNQWANARHLADHDAAVIVEDNLLNEQLASELVRLLRNQSARTEMANATKQLARPDAALSIAEELMDLASTRRTVKKEKIA